MLIRGINDMLMDSLLAQVFGDLWSSVISTEFFLVDVFLEDVAENGRINLSIVAPRHVVKTPRKISEQSENVVECGIGNLNSGEWPSHQDVTLNALFYSVWQKQTAIQIWNIAKRDFSNQLALSLGLGETFEEKVAKKVRIELVLAFR